MDGTCSSSEEINGSHGQGCVLVKHLDVAVCRGGGGGGVEEVVGHGGRVANHLCTEGHCQASVHFNAMPQNDTQCVQIKHVSSFRLHSASGFGKFQHHYVLM